MGLDDICAEFPMMGVHTFLKDLRIYGDGDHPQQEVIERLIELSEKCAVDYIDMQDYWELVNAVYTVNRYLDHGWYKDETGQMQLRGTLKVQDDGLIVWNRDPSG